MSALATRAHYEAAASEATLLASLRTLERSAKDEALARIYCTADDLQRCELASLDARVEAFRIMGQLGLDARIVGSALS